MYKFLLSFCIFFTIVLTGCSPKDSSQIQENVPAVEKEVTVFISQRNTFRGSSTYEYYIREYPGSSYTLYGSESCEQLFPLVLGKEYRTKIQIQNNRPLRNRDLCEFIYRLKLSNPTVKTI